VEFELLVASQAASKTDYVREFKKNGITLIVRK
jgi:hypothetical protein